MKAMKGEEKLSVLAGQLLCQWGNLLEEMRSTEAVSDSVSGSLYCTRLATGIDP